MIQKTIYIPRYDWVAHFYLDVCTKDADEVLYKLLEVGVNRATFIRVKRNLYIDALDSGFTYSRKSEHTSVVSVSRATSNREMLNSIAHEIRHLCDDIADECTINLSGEEIAYLTGAVTMQLFLPITRLICQCPICKH